MSRLEEVQEQVSAIIESHIKDIDRNDFGPVYEAMWEADFSDEYISTLTELFWQADIEPLEYLTYVPEGYASYLFKPEVLKVPGNCKYISSNAFCYSFIEELIIEEGCEEIFNFAVSSCNSLSSLYLPKSLVRFCKSSFSHCDNLSYIKYNGTKEEFSRIEIFGYQGSILERLLECTNSTFILIECTDGEITL